MSRIIKRLRQSGVASALAIILGLAVGSCGGSSDAPDGEPTYVDSEGETFSYDTPGDLEAGASGRVDYTAYAPDMRFPLESSPAYLNSQVYGYGGMHAPGAGSQCEAVNYSYPWHDNFCEPRSWDAAMCPSDQGHQGQDIRAATCSKQTHWAVATEAGQITSIGTYTVTLMGDSGRRYRYMHLDMGNLSVTSGETVSKGERIGKVSNDFGGSSTTIHLHFDMSQVVETDDGEFFTFAPPYMSLVESYQALLSGGG